MVGEIGLWIIRNLPSLVTKADSKIVQLELLGVAVVFICFFISIDNLASKL